jgi:hypothetical protein
MQATILAASETAEQVVISKKHFNTGLLEPKNVHKGKVVKFMRELIPEWE